MRAALEGNAEVAQQLMEAGISSQSAMIRGAAFEGNAEVIRQVLGAGRVLAAPLKSWPRDGDRFRGCGESSTTRCKITFFLSVDLFRWPVSPALLFPTQLSVDFWRGPGLGAIHVVHRLRLVTRITPRVLGSAS
jgi:hypothetical protein